jgi:phosphomannomutase/phosphoglucomutase
MKSSIFRKYDVRGVYPRDLDRDTVVRLGAVMGEMAEGGTVAVGRDVRSSGPELFGWLSAGAALAGAKVTDLGAQTTPMTYFAAHTLEPEVTVMITGSHNPPEYNGFKMMLGKRTLYGDDIQEIRRRMEERRLPSSLPKPRTDSADLADDYADRLLSEFCLDRSVHVVVDGGNGAGGEIASRVLSLLGCRVTELYCAPDGDFPNHHPDPTVVENLADLRREVTRQGADLGIAFDGDADRLGVVDENGTIVWGDRVLIVLARALLRERPGSTVISEVKASRLFFSEVEKAGGRAVMSPTGHSIIKERMVSEDAMLAGEMSGHIFYRDRYYGYDDALYAALRLIEVLAAGQAPLSRLTADLPRVWSTPEIREDCPEEQKFGVVDIVRKRLEDLGLDVTDIDGVRVELPDGWGLLRASNTQPVLVMRFEAESPEALERYRGMMRSHLEEARREMDEQGDR